MDRNWARFVLLPALMGVVLAGPALAICSMPSPQSCCCSDSCPADTIAKVQAVGCCAPAPPAPIPPASAHERITITMANVSPSVCSELPVIVHDDRVAACRPELPREARGVSLFTLHASLLI